MSGVSIRVRTIGDGSKRYMVRYRRGGRPTHLEGAGTFATQREAKLRARLVEDWLASGLNPRVMLSQRVSEARTVQEAQEAWILSRRRVAHGTLDGYRHRAVRIIRDLGAVQLELLTVSDLIDWVGELTADYKPGTVRLFVTQLRMILDFEGVQNVARDRRVELPRDPRREPDPPDAPLIETLLGTVADQMLLPVLALEQLGSRVTETLMLGRDDIDVGRVRFRREEAKQGYGRWVGCDSLLTDALAKAVPFRLSRAAVFNAMSEAVGFGPHQLRHRRASLWYQQDVGPVELARRLGHARPSMSLDVYAHVKPLREVSAHVFASALR